MDRILVRGGRPLSGTIPISGAKNAALPLMAAGLLSDGPLVLTNAPDLADIATMAALLLSGSNEVDASSTTPAAAALAYVVRSPPLMRATSGCAATRTPKRAVALMVALAVRADEPATVASNT